MDESEKLLLKNLMDAVQRVENVENNVIEVCGELKGQIENMKEKVDDHNEFIEGNSKEGAVIRLDRVEQTMKIVKRIGYGILTISIATCGTIVGKLIYDYFKTKEIVEKVVGG